MKGRTIRWIAELEAKRNKAALIKAFKFQWLKDVNKLIDLEMVSFSGEKQFEDQLFSILSFYINVGTPQKWTIFSDGSHSKETIHLLLQIPGLTIEHPGDELVPIPYRNQKNPLLKKIFYYKTISIENTTIFVDSDVLFYNSFGSFIPSLKKGNWFLVDENYGYLDRSYLSKVNFDMYPCNSGMLVFNIQPEWDVVLSYLDHQKSQQEGLQHWSEQTAFHVLSRNFKKMFPLDPRYFVVDGRDSFSLGHCVDYNKIAVRHFVGPVRHKMWQYHWKKVLF